MQQKNGLQTISQFGLLLLSKDKKNNLKSLPTFVGGDFFTYNISRNTYNLNEKNYKNC